MSPTHVESSATSSLDLIPGIERSGTGRRWLRRFLPLIVTVIVLVLLWAWISTRELDSIEQRTLNWDYITSRTGEHLLLTAVASALVAIIAIPTGIAVSRSNSRIFRGVVSVIANIGQATPAVGLVILLAIAWRTGFATALIALVAYSFLPVLRNTVTGLDQVEPSIRESARGMGMTAGQSLWRVELPLASPVIIAGLRTALVFCVGVATIATFINAGGLGDMIINGLKLQRYNVTLTGAVLVAAIAVLIDWFAGLVEDLVRPRGL